MPESNSKPIRVGMIGCGTIAQIAHRLDKARRVLGWNPRSSEEAIVATGESLARFGLLKS